MSVEVTVTVSRGSTSEVKRYLLKQIGKSKRGTYLTFSPVGDSADIPEFSKLYVKAKRGKNGKDKANGKAKQ